MKQNWYFQDFQDPSQVDNQLAIWKNLYYHIYLRSLFSDFNYRNQFDEDILF